ncbi:MAG TPA: bifunctional methylenetetrahydrofolate dehydrogenase/methenyltetrahydrofolate cyclohydrolase FolD [Firmicutes bacterium]|nr:bifunctional methylenetetrahydrofolate dehydrogenase/methenyltetrahydrofolate cyclohydrolase FolD [Bacillota bacterium]
MGAQLIDGKRIAAEIRQEVKAEVAELRERNVVPGLTVVLVGEDPASQTYVRSKQRACEEVGIRSEVRKLPDHTSQTQLMKLIDELNQDPAVHGILVQLPLPGHIDADAVLRTIDPAKDVDGFHPTNVGCLWTGLSYQGFVPCTPAGVMELLRRTGIDPRGLDAVVVGRSNIVGKPMAALLLEANATVTICHSRTQNLRDQCRRADILVVAVGKPRFISGDWIKPGAVVIDVGINRVDGRLCGDVDESAWEVAGFLTPVPGGVGPMTIAQLLKNTVLAAKRTL